MITYNEETKAYSIGQCFETPFGFCKEDLEEDGCAKFMGSMGLATEDEYELESIEAYKKVVKGEIKTLNHILKMLGWVDKTFTNVVTHADFYPREGNYNTYIEIPTDQFLEYCKTHNLPIPE